MVLSAKLSSVRIADISGEINFFVNKNYLAYTTNAIHNKLTYKYKKMGRLY